MGFLNSALLPARAGMILSRYNVESIVVAAPRTRGDDPSTPTMSLDVSACSPHARG